MGTVKSIESMEEGMKTTRNYESFCMEKYLNGICLYSLDIEEFK